MTLDSFTKAYIEAALWSSNDESTPQGGEPLDANYGITDIAPATRETIIADCKRFQEQNAALLIDANCFYKRCATLEYAGHDFWRMCLPSGIRNSSCTHSSQQKYFPRRLISGVPMSTIHVPAN